MVWGDADPNEVKDTWATELGAFIGDDIKTALDSLRTVHPSYPPTLFEFSGLCRDASRNRASRAAKLSAPRDREPIPPHILAEIQRFKDKVRGA